ncbi:MAG: hypothetical protein LBF15_05970 [Candidatus Peribacteria bacterium]|nr:hypothetical protein [Candidatus Peribacteria bacterium]
MYVNSQVDKVTGSHSVEVFIFSATLFRLDERFLFSSVILHCRVSV